MFCDYCINAGVEPEKSSFVKGCTNIKLGPIKVHQASNSHLYSTSKYLNDNAPQDAPAVKAQISLNKDVARKLSVLFRNVHALNIKARPLTDYFFLSELDEKKGLELPGDRYKTRHACKEFTEAIADVEREKIINRYKSSEFVAVIVDGSIDSATIDNEIVFMQTCIDGDIHTDFLRFCQVETGNAEGILKAIKQASTHVDKWENFSKKLVALGSDGASVMLGKNKGVIALLQKENSRVIGVHCSGHRLELAYKDAAKQNVLAEKILTMLTGLYYFYRNSALNRTNLKAAFKCLDVKVLIPTRVGGTRWVGHVVRALDNFVNGYKGIRLHLEQLVASKERGDSKAKALGFLKLMKSYDVMAMVLFLQDVLFVLKKVSLKFQEENSVAADISLTIKSTITQLQILKSKDGPFLQQIREFEISDVPSTGSTTRSLVRLTGNHDQLPRQQEQLIDNLCHALSVRFAETETEEVLKATSLANFKLWPADETELQGVYIGIVLIFACIRIFLITYFLCIYHFYFSCMIIKDACLHVSYIYFIYVVLNTHFQIFAIT